MHKTIKKLREKPAHVRERVATIATLASLIVLVLFWVWTLSFRFGEASKSSTQANAFHPFTILKDSFTNIYDGIKNPKANSDLQFKNTTDTSQTSNASNAVNIAPDPALSGQTAQ